MANSETAVVLLSGGIGSAVAAYRQRTMHELRLVFVDAGQPALDAEQDAAQAIAESLGRPLEVIALPDLTRLAKSDTSNAAPIAGGDLAADRQLANRLGLLNMWLGVATRFASLAGARHLVTGHSVTRTEGQTTVSAERTVHLRDHLHAYRLLLEISFPPIRPIELHTPLIDYQPQQIMKLGERLATPLARTYSCQRSPTPCNQCPGCTNRATLFGQPDAISTATVRERPAQSVLSARAVLSARGGQASDQDQQYHDR